MFNDEEVIHAVESYLEDPIFFGEGYIKIRERIKVMSGICVKKDRLNKLLRDNNLLSMPYRKPNPANRNHDGRIITDIPDKMWATDIKEFKIDGRKYYFIGVIDHFNDEIHGWHISSKADKFSTLEPLYQAILKRFGRLENDICNGLYLYLRSDNGSQFISKIYIQELKYYGIIHSPAFVNSPECNGIIERFHRTLNEQFFYCNNFKNINEAINCMEHFIKKYNNHWICHRLGLMSPVKFRLDYEKQSKLKKYSSEYTVNTDNENIFQKYSIDEKHFLKNELLIT